MEEAFALGYRAVDTAASYGNEREVGLAVRRASSAVTVITKIRGSDHGYRAATQALQRQLRELQADHVDVLLIHWPLPRLGLYVETWRALLNARDRGLATVVGVSNFTASMIARLVAATGERPAINEVECHPLHQQDDLLRAMQRDEVVVLGWSPLCKGDPRLMSNDVVRRRASMRGWNVSDAVLRWHRARGVVPVVKSRSPAHLARNLAVASEPAQQGTEGMFAGLGSAHQRGGSPESHVEM